jgi:hypothetical protein
MKVTAPRAWAAFFLLAFVSGFCFSYDGSIQGGHDGVFTRYNFIQQASDIATARNILQGRGAGNAVKINKLFLIGADDVDEEDVQMVNDTVEYISENFQVNNGDGFSYIVKRGDTDRGLDGWLLFSHYLHSQGWFHYIYYFEIRE